MNDNQVSETDNELHDVIKVSCEEQPYDGFEGCWPGDGSGLSDFDDYNQNEGGDY
jgi:hypothetical protein